MNFMYNAELAKYYDIIYSNKNYEFESKVIKTFCKEKVKLIDVGCGTLSHSILLKDFFQEIVGIDLSSEMIKKAQQKISKNKIKNIKVIDIGIENINYEDFDCGIAMFNVINHIISLNELISFFKNFERVLKKGGILIFDSWNEAAAISDPPKKSEKYNSFENFKIKSTSSPENNLLQSLININYNHIIHKDDCFIENFSLKLEHRLWPKFVIEELLSNLNFKKIKIFSISNETINESPSLNDYKITYVFKKC